MYNPTLRLLTVLELLQSRDEISGHALALTLEVDERSVRRYIMMLRDMGIPIEGERGRHGGYSLRPGFKMPPLIFNADEIAAIKMSLMLMREVGAAPLQAVESANAKIERVLTDELRAITAALEQSLVLDEIRHGTRAVTSEQIVLFSRSVQQGTSVAIVYASSEGDTTERTIDPYGIVLHAQSWFVPAYCHLRNDVRVFRLDRVKAASITNRTFSRPADFDAREYVLHSLATVHSTFIFEVILHVPLSTAQEYISPALAILEDMDGKTLMRCYSDDPHWLARYLVHSEMPFTVIGPDELRDALKSLADEISASLA